jgi:hypothetical protein
VVAQGIERIDDLIGLDGDDVEELCTIIRNNNNNNNGNRQEDYNGTSPNFLQERLFKAMAYWVNSRQRMGLEIQAEYFTRDEAVKCLTKMKVGSKQHHYGSLTAQFPSLDARTDWFEFFDDFKGSFRSYLSLIKGANGTTPLVYVIRENQYPGPNGSSGGGRSPMYYHDVDREIAAAPLDGDAYANDNRTVYHLLRLQAVNSGKATEVLSGFDAVQDGRGAWFALIRRHALMKDESNEE